MGTQLPEEPIIVVKVRDLINDLGRDMNKRMDEIARKLDDRVTIGVFNALRADLDNAIRRLIDAEGEIDKLQEGTRIEAIAREAARQALANETERRRLELEKPVRAWGIRSNKANVVYAAVAVAVIAYGMFRAYLAWRGIGG